jgi:hypothetical protein
VGGEVLPYFGGRSRFYVGPLLWLEQRWFGKEVLDNGQWTESIESGMNGGSGVGGGIALGPRELVDLTFSVRIGTAVDHLSRGAVGTSFGVTIHQMVGD